MALTQVKTNGIEDDAVTLAKQAAGTDGQIITYDASGNPVAVGPGTDGQVLTSTGAGSPPAFEAIPAAAVTAINNATQNELVTVGATTTELDAEANLHFDGTALRIGPSLKGSHASMNDIFLGGAGHMYAETTAAAGNSFSISQNAHVATDGGWKYVVTDEASNIYQYAGAVGFRTAPSGTADSAITWTERLTVANTGDVTVGDGNLVIGTAGHGIDFSAQTTSQAGGATPATSSGDETLSHYEEGTWTPTVASGITSPSYLRQYGSYIRIGNQVTISFYLTLDGGTPTSATVQFGGLPFAAANNNNYIGMPGYNNASASTIDNPIPIIFPNTSLIDYYKQEGQSVGTVTGTVMGNAGSQLFWATYITP